MIKSNYNFLSSSRVWCSSLVRAKRAFFIKIKNNYNRFIKYFFINKLQHARSIDRVFFDIISNYKTILGERDAKENTDLANVYICL